MSEVGISNGLSKSSQKKKNKKEATAASVVATEPLPPNTGVQDVSDSGSGAKVNGDAAYESPYIKDLQRNIRNITKKLNATQRVDAIQAENPGVSLDDLVASRKINNDQKTQALKKPSLEAQQAQLEEQIATYKKVELDIQAHAAEEKTRMEQAHQKELEAMRTMQEQVKAQAAAATRAHLLTISNFLRAAAARRQMEDDTSEESKAFEGLLLLLYGGDVAAVDAAEKLINGSNDSVMSTEGTTTTVSYSRVRELAAEIAPIEDDDAPAAEPTDVHVNGDAASIVHTDPTIAHAGLTEQTDEPIPTEPEVLTGPEQADIGEGAANAAATRNWDSNAVTNGSDSVGESWISVPRPADDTEKSPTATTQNDTNNWTSGDGGQNGYNAATVDAGASVADVAVAVDVAKIPEADNWAEDSQDNYEQSAAKAGADDGYQPAPVKKHKSRGGAGGDARGGAGAGRGSGRGGNRGRGGERGGSRGGQRGGTGQARGNRPRDS